MPSYDPEDNEGPEGPEPDPFDPPACNAVAADRVWAMLDLGRAQREADALTSRSAYEQLRAAEQDNLVAPLATHGYVNPAKFQLIVEELTWLGRLLRDGKGLLDPSYVAGVTALHKPADAGSLSTFLGI
jgi:hypothetical protein